MANRHLRDLKISRRRTAAIAAPLAVATTVATIAFGVLGNDQGDETMAIDTQQFSGSISGVSDRGEIISRTGRDRAEIQQGATIKRLPSKADKMMRPGAVKAAVDGAHTERWTTELLNLWTRPDGKAKKVGTIEETEQVLVTGRKHLDRQEIVLDGKSRWVTAGYLEEEKPVAPAPAPTGGTSGGSSSGESEAESESQSTGGTGGTCSNGTSVPSGVSAGVVAVHRAVCSRWPSISTYGTFRSDSGDHGSGRAVDIMISGGTGWDIANYLRANAGAFDISYIIYSQKIWSVERGGEGWRSMSDRGGTTANHYDHVHVSTY